MWDAHTVDVWVHHPDVLTVPTLDNEPPGSQSIDWNCYLVLRSDDNFLKIREVIRLKPEGGNPGLMVGTVLRVTSQPDTPIEAGAKVELTFELENFPMQSGSKLLESVKKSPLEYIGHDWASQTITVYTLAEIPTPRELVTINTVVPVHGTPYLSLKFQTDQAVRLSPNERRARTVQIRRRRWDGEKELLTFSIEGRTDTPQYSLVSRFLFLLEFTTFREDTIARQRLSLLRFRYRSYLGHGW